MVTSQIGQAAAAKQALDSLALDPKNGDTGLQVESTVVDGQWVQLTSMRDGLPRPRIPRVHAERVLRKTLADGSPAFWVEGMGYSPPKPQIGSIKCFFHPDFDEADGPSGIGREFIVNAGLGDFTCNDKDKSKQNRGDFKTVMQRDEHMKSRHRRQIQTIEKAQGDDKEQQERTEVQLDRELQRQQTGAMLKLMEMQIGSPGEALALEHMNADGLRAYADKRNIELSNRQSVTSMREEIEAFGG